MRLCLNFEDSLMVEAHAANRLCHTHYVHLTVIAQRLDRLIELNVIDGAELFIVPNDYLVIRIGWVFPCGDEEHNVCEADHLHCLYATFYLTSDFLHKLWDSGVNPKTLICTNCECLQILVE
jgi:hypothetical protein